MIDRKKVLGEYEKFLGENYRGDSNFNHVVRNLLGTANVADFLKHQKVAEGCLGYLERYLSLLEEFPGFKEKELTQNTDEAAFAKVYIDSSYERLRGKLPEKIPGCDDKAK